MMFDTTDAASPMTKQRTLIASNCTAIAMGSAYQTTAPSSAAASAILTATCRLRALL
jgi:hypothetical protein